MNIKIEHFQINPSTDTVYLSTLPNGIIRMIIPEEYINRQEGKINIKKFKKHLDTLGHVFIEYDFD
jgi:hypothetical protein